MTGVKYEKIFVSIAFCLILISITGCKKEIDDISKFGEAIVSGFNDIVEEVDESMSDLIYKPRKEANDLFEEFMVALENNNNSAIKSMFAEDLINSNDKIDEEIQNAVDFFEGNIVSYDYVGTPASSESYREGELVYANIGSAYTKSIVTDVETYRLSFSAVIINKKKPTQEGIWRFWIGRNDDEQIIIGSDNYD